MSHWEVKYFSCYSKENRNTRKAKLLKRKIKHKSNQFLKTVATGKKKDLHWPMMEFTFDLYKLQVFSMILL